MRAFVFLIPPDKRKMTMKKYQRLAQQIMEQIDRGVWQAGDRLPSLRERVEDIVPLARHFLLRECRRLGRDAMVFAPSAERAMRTYTWPGNVRELEHAVERAMLLASGKEIDAADLALSRSTDTPLVLDSLTLPDAEEMLIRNALERNDHNLQRAAEALGISRQALYRRLDKHRSKSHSEQVD